MPNRTNELEQFIYQKCYDRIWEAVYGYVAAHPNSLELGYSRVQYPDSAMLEDMILEFSTNINIDEDTLSFDAVVSCVIMLEQETYHDTVTAEVSQWFKVHCFVVVEDGIKNFNVHDIDIYSKGKRAMTTGVAATNNIVPIICKNQLETEATRFLERYCPEALQIPMAVPIEKIVKEKMGLNILHGNRLTDDFSLFGQICFSQGSVKVYDLLTDTCQEVEVERGTILIDAYTFWERNIGCVNNTIAHEAFHWHRHRVYAAIKSILRGEKLIACRCPTSSKGEKQDDSWTDEDSMEWQASQIAPRILMPIETAAVKIKELLDMYGYSPGSADKTEILECVIDELASFYKVSKQSAKIRMIDLGYNEAAGVYNYKDSYAPYFSNISPRDAFYEYCDNEEFRAVIDSGLFRYASGYFIINNEKYLTQDSTGQYVLTNYAWSNLAECALQFTYHRVNMREHGRFHTDVFHRANRQAYEKLPRFDADRNISVIDNAEELRRKQEEFEEQFADYRAITPTFAQLAADLMKRKRWNSVTFKEKTHLDDATYSRIVNNEEKEWSLRTVMAVCVGLGVNARTTDKLLAAAGHTLSTSREHQLFSFLLTSFEGQSIDECNTFLESMEIMPLGNRPRKREAVS
ncbi:ImmA/IrrE family metallo-endopeptidase [Anaeroselena agilis]|uniref:IrrE N-terminal-like domain-containing protein n=1 Tax=Anaeroselena agilis TaxID=3063788 RepID=A0ABU3NTT8_9FIRM|nr:hypothetical protein [Selenomonadales bacterium 4137-cl]